MSEISDFQRKFFAHGLGNKLFTEQEFVEAVAAAKAEMMAVAIHTSRQVVFIERDACADVIEQLATQEDEGEVCTALRNAAEAIRNRIPSQRQ